MKRYTPYLLFAVLGATGSLSQDREQSHALGKYIRFSADHRFRFEDYRDLRYTDHNDDHWLLHRIRLNLSIIPTNWFAFHVQGQDSRVFFKLNKAGSTTYINRTDVRMGYAELKRGHFILKVGRQELAYGEDRLLGAANWGNVARTFDAAKLVFTQGPIKLDLFSASVVRIDERGLSEHQPGNNLHGAYLQWKSPKEGMLQGATLEPYFYWRVGTTTRGHQDRRVVGFRFLGPLPRRFDYSTETVQQYGSISTQAIRAFATHLQLRYSFARGKWKPRWINEYNFATGDGNPNDRVSGTFDQIYPTPHNKTGLADQVGWVNIHNLASAIEVNPWRKLILRTGVHDWRLAQSRDGLYQVNGTLIFRDTTGRSGTHVGNEFDTMATYTSGPHTISLGYSHIFAGRYLRSFTQGDGLDYFYLNVGYRF